MNVYVLLGGILLAIALFIGGVKTGEAFKQVEWDQEKGLAKDHIITVQKVVIQKVPKIVETTVTKEVTVEKEVERVVTASQHMLSPDCVLPGDFGMLLVAAANGVDPTGSVDEIAGAYGCREVLAAVLSDLRAGWRNTARLEGLQQYEKVVRSAETHGETSTSKVPP